MEITPVDLREIDKRAANVYEAIIVAAKRARAVNDEIKIEFNQRIQPIMEKEEEDENVVSKDKMNISIEFEKRKKPTDVGLSELLNDQLEFRDKNAE